MRRSQHFDLDKARIGKIATKQRTKADGRVAPMSNRSLIRGGGRLTTSRTARIAPCRQDTETPQPRLDTVANPWASRPIREERPRPQESSRPTATRVTSRRPPTWIVHSHASTSGGPCTSHTLSRLHKAAVAVLAALDQCPGSSTAASSSCPQTTAWPPCFRGLRAFQGR